MANKTYIIKTNFWAHARVLVPWEAETEDQAIKEFKEKAEEFFNAEIKDLEIEAISDNPMDFAGDVADEDPEEDKQLH